MRDVVALRALPAQLRAQAVGLVFPGIERDGAVQAGLTGVHVSQEPLHRGQVVVVLRPRGFQFDGAPVLSQCLGLQVQSGQQQAQGGVLPAGLQVAPGQGGQQRARIVGAPQPHQAVGLLQQVAGVIGLQLQGPVDGLQRHPAVVEAQGDLAGAVPAGSIVGIALVEESAAGNGLLYLAPLQELPGLVFQHFFRWDMRLFQNAVQPGNRIGAG